MLRLLFLWSLVWSLSVAAQAAADPSGNSRVAVALSNLRFYSDSSFIRPTETIFLEGALFEVQAETWREHPDNANDQKFKWYFLSADNGTQGWVFGDQLAIIMPDFEVDQVFKPYHKQKYQFSNGFEETTLWIGELRGHDNFYPEETRNPLYRELYLVASSAKGYSVALPVASLSTQGVSTISNLSMRDVTGDSIAEIIVEHSSRNTNSKLDQRKIEIFGFQSGSLVRLLDEYCTLTWAEDELAPAGNKSISIGDGTVRVAYIEYSNSKTEDTPNNQIRKLSYVTYTQQWDARRKCYKPLYKETHQVLAGKLNENAPIFTKNTPDGEFIGILDAATEFIILQQSERRYKLNNKTVLDCMLEIQLGSGKTGWVKASAVQVQAAEFTQLLQRYWQNPPLVRNDLMLEHKILSFE